MKKLDPTLERGMAAEERFIRVARTLRTREPDVFFWAIRAKRKLDRVGFDAFTVVRTLDGHNLLSIPWQVKSSERGVESFYLKYPQYRDGGPIPIIVNERVSDEQILRKVMEQIAIVLFQGKDFKELYEFLENRVEPYSKDRGRYNMRDPIPFTGEKNRRTFYLESKRTVRDWKRDLEEYHSTAR
jgi:hypothetical protein